MQTLCLLALWLTGWQVLGSPSPASAPAGDQAAVTATAVNDPVPIPYRLVDGVDRPQPRIPPSPPAQAPIPAPAQAPVVYVYYIYYYYPSTPPPQEAVDYSDAYYNPVFKGADQWHYVPWPEYLLRGQFRPWGISYPYPDPPRDRCFYRYDYGAMRRRDPLYYRPPYTPRAKCHLP